ncbi:MAG: putative quinol monooxygenase [Micromonosporaceae bacterium]
MIIQLRGRVADGRWDDLVSFLRTAIPFYEGPGGIRVRLLRDAGDPNAFIEIVEYETEAAYAADQRRVQNDPAMIARLEEWRRLLAGPIEVQTLRDVTPAAGTARHHADS